MDKLINDKKADFKYFYSLDPLNEFQK